MTATVSSADDLDDAAALVDACSLFWIHSFIDPRIEHPCAQRRAGFVRERA